ncbi:hypothetical protein H6P81_004068 [Aristolochia fimbriata]|uniref:Large ribosomal subunit protein uL22c n=1 Tax=Aristolochia fimbriata TaxID=158543 RepID=A0AAV7FEC6_ARIFI|nr:hypothetical protein H6P81_004068 [Aristolochia fimbriata]
MVGWQRHLSSIFRLVGNAAKQEISAHGTHFRACSSHFLSGQFCVQQRTFALSSNITLRPLYHYLQHQGISTSRGLLADSSSDANVTPVASPLIPLSSPNTANAESKTVVAKRSKVQAVRKGIKQSPKKVNLVAALVRGMRVEDALLQLQVTIKRAAQTVYQVINSARANATHNHGLDPDRLLVAEAFVGKGFFKKRISYHSKGRSGIKMRPECRLTVVVREITPEEEAEIAKLKVAKFKKLTKRERRLVPHKLIETTPIWGLKRKLRNDSTV